MHKFSDYESSDCLTRHKSAPEKQKKPVHDFDTTPNVVGEAIDFFRHTSNSLLA